jgi:hypothetical protein
LLFWFCCADQSSDPCLVCHTLDINCRVSAACGSRPRGAVAGQITCHATPLGLVPQLPVPALALMCCSVLSRGIPRTA